VACELPLQGHAARDLDPLAVDPAIVVGKQGRDHRADFLGPSGAAEGCHFRHALVDFRVVADHAAAEVGRDGAGRNGVDRDPARTQFLCQVACQDLNRPFHGGVSAITFGQRSAVFAMRERKADIARDGLIAVAMINQERVDFRDILMCLSFLYHAASRVGANSDAMFRQIATLAEPEVGKQMVGFVGQTPTHRNLRSSWGYDEMETENGPGFVGWEFAEYHPTIDLKPLVMEVAQFIAADKYQPGTVAVASELPPVWLSRGKNPELAMVLGRVRAGASISARLRPNEHPKYDCQQFTVFIVETPQSDDAKTLLRLSQAEEARGHSMIGVASGRLFSLIVARAFMDGVEAYETPKTIVRFKVGLTKILDRYSDKDK